MILEVLLPENSEACWLAKVVMVAGQLLWLRWLGSEEGDEEFWCDALSDQVHAPGWSEDNVKLLKPPAHLEEKVKGTKEQLITEAFRTESSVPKALIEMVCAI